MEKKTISIELLRIIASFAVVMIHVCYMSYLQFANPSDLSYLKIYNVMCFAVPNFLMITGFLQLNPNKNFKIGKAIKKVLLPLVIYGFIFSSLEYYFNYKSISVGTFLFAIKSVIAGTTWAHMWYLYTIIGIYLLMPFIRVLVSKITTKQGLILIGLLIISASIIPWIESNLGIEFGFYLPVSNIYITYLLMGYYLPQIDIPIKFTSVITIIFVILAIISPELEYNNIIIVIMSAGIFKLFLQSETHIKKIWNKYLGIISKNTFGIYILHMVTVNLIYKLLKINPYTYNKYLVWILITLFVFHVTLLMSIIVNKVPFFNKIFGIH